MYILDLSLGLAAIKLLWVQRLPGFIVYGDPLYARACFSSGLFAWIAQPSPASPRIYQPRGFRILGVSALRLRGAAWHIRVIHHSPAGLIRAPVRRI